MTDKALQARTMGTAKPSQQRNGRLAPHAPLDNPEKVMPVLAKLYVVSGDDFEVVLSLPGQFSADPLRLRVSQLLELGRSEAIYSRDWMRSAGGEACNNGPADAYLKKPRIARPFGTGRDAAPRRDGAHPSRSSQVAFHIKSTLSPQGKSC